MISTPMGASRHYTLSFGELCGWWVMEEGRERREREREKRENGKKKTKLERRKKKLTFFPLPLSTLHPPPPPPPLLSGEFCARLAQDAPFAARLAPLRADVAALASGPRWNGKGPFPTSRWTRLLLLQQLLVEAMDLLDPEGARVPVSRRTPLAGVKFAPLIPPRGRARTRTSCASLMQQRNALLGGGGGAEERPGGEQRGRQGCARGDGSKLERLRAS